MTRRQYEPRSVDALTLTSVDNVPFVKIVYRLEDLFDRLGGILLCKLALITDPIEQLTPGSKLGHNVELVLRPS